MVEVDGHPMRPRDLPRLFVPLLPWLAIFAIVYFALRPFGLAWLAFCVTLVPIAVLYALAWHRRPRS